MHDYLTIAAIARDRAVGGVDDLPALGKRPLPELIENALAYGLVAHDAPAGHVRWAGLELGLQQDHARCAPGQARRDGGQHLAQGDEGDVGDKEVEGRELGEVAGVGAFHGGHARVFAQLLVELPTAHVNGDHGNGAVLEQAVGEAARGGADIEAAQAGHIDGEGIEGGLELAAAATHVALDLAQVEGSALIEHGGGLHQRERARAGAPGHDQPAGALARLGETPVNEQLVGANASHLRKASACAPLWALAARRGTIAAGMRLYSDLAGWFHLLTAPEEYAFEAAHYRKALVETCDGPAVTLLELGSGGGNNASHLKQWFTCTLTDLSPEMLAQSRTINPECEHIQGDMRSLRLGRTFDVVFVHDAVVYLTEIDDLRAAVATAFAHVRPGGAVAFVPDYIRETIKPETNHGGHDGSDGRSMRYLEWVRDEDPDDSQYEADLIYVLREADGSVRVEHDQCIEGLFTRAQWLETLQGAGFEAGEYPAGDPVECPGPIFVGKKPA